MFPHPEQPSSGPFVHEQVQALRRCAGIDARVVVGRPYWMKTKHPVKAWRADQVYRRFHRYSRRWFDLAGVPVCYLPYRIFGPWLTQGWSYRAAMLDALRWIRDDFCFDLVHAHTGYLDGSAGLAIARRCGVPLVVTEHTGPFSILMRNPVVRYWTLRSIKGASRIIVVSHSQRRAVAEHLNSSRLDRFVVLPNVVDTDLFRPQETSWPDPRAPRIVFVGYFVPIKQLPLLLAAFQLVIKQVPGATLRLVGGGETREQEFMLHADIKRLGLQNRVTVQGHQTRQAVARIIREQCDLLVLCSQSETFGCVLTEAMACGKPVVATRCGGPEDIVTHEELGRLCECQGAPKAEDLAAAILQVVDRLREFSPQRIRRHAEERFGFAAVARQIGDVYRDVLAGARRNEMQS
jgi:glycosyltransferase involved in cell wall biosynthesis